MANRADVSLNRTIQYVPC